MINNRVGYKGLILTSGALIVKNTYLTYLLKIDNSTIESYEIKTGIAVKRFKLNLKILRSFAHVYFYIIVKKSLVIFSSQKSKIK